MDKLPVVGNAGTSSEHLDMTDDELESEIKRLKKERNAVILAHYYQESEIQDLADFVGDSLQLSQAAKQTGADVIVFCGDNIFAVSAMKRTPQKAITLASVAAALRDKSRLSPTKSARSWIAGFW